MSLSFQRISTILISKSKSGYALFKIEEILKIKQKKIVLLLIKRRYFFGTPSSLKNFRFHNEYDDKFERIKLNAILNYAEIFMQVCKYCMGVWSGYCSMKITAICHKWTI